MVSAEASCAVWPSGLVTVRVRAPVAAPSVFTVRVSEVGDVKATLVTTTPDPLNAAARRRRKPAPGSKKPERGRRCAVHRHGGTGESGGQAVGRQTDAIAAGGGASRRTSRTV